MFSFFLIVFNPFLYEKLDKLIVTSQITDISDMFTGKLLEMHYKENAFEDNPGICQVIKVDEVVFEDRGKKLGFVSIARFICFSHPEGTLSYEVV